MRETHTKVVIKWLWLKLPHHRNCESRRIIMANNTEEHQDIQIKGKPVSGRTWKVEKEPLRAKNRVVKNKKLTSWELKKQKRLEDQQFKEKVRALKEEKKAEKDAVIQALKERRAKKEEQERYDRLAAKMHAKKVDRLRRREKRNKALKER